MIHIVDKDNGIDIMAVDDSNMPTPDEVKNFPDTTELDKETSREIDEICKKKGLL